MGEIPPGSKREKAFPEEGTRSKALQRQSWARWGRGATTEAAAGSGRNTGGVRLRAASSHLGTNGTM